MDAERGFEPTIQKCMYGAVIIGIAFLVVSQFERYHTVTKKIKVTLRSVGIVIIGLCTMYLFQKCNKYFSNEIPPQYQEGDCESTLSFVRWQKDRHKIERDMYLATVGILKVKLIYHFMLAL